MNEFAKNFNYFIEYFGLSNQQVAKIMDVHYTSIGRWRKEDGDEQPKKPQVIQKFAEHYRLRPEETNQLLQAAGFAPMSSTEPSAPSVPTENTLSPPQTPINPFIVGQPVRAQHFFGREDIIHNLYRLWLDHPSMPIQNAALWGEKRIGKTSLLLQLKDLVDPQTDNYPWRNNQRKKEYNKLRDYTWIYIDFQSPRFNTRYKFLSYLWDKLNLPDKESNEEKLELSPENPLEQFTEMVTEHLQTPTIILLDEVSAILERCPDEYPTEFWEALRSLSTTGIESACLGFVISSPKHPKELNKLLQQNKGLASEFFNIFGYAVKINSFTQNEATELLDSSPIPFSQEDKDFMLKYSQGKPSELQSLCRQRLDMLMNGEETTDTRWQTIIQE